MVYIVMTANVTSLIHALSDGQWLGKPMSYPGDVVQESVHMATSIKWPRAQHHPATAA